MRNSPAELVRAALVAKGVAVIPSDAIALGNLLWSDGAALLWSDGVGLLWGTLVTVIYVGHLPDTPDEVACVFDTPGFTEGRIQRTGETITKSGWQVRVRAPDHATAYAIISNIQAALDAVRNLPVAIQGNGYTINAITQSGGVLALGQEPEAKRRNGFTLNGTVTYREAPR